MPKISVFRRSWMSLAATALMQVAASGAVFELEPFDYPSSLGSGLDTLAGGTGWGEAWTDTDTLPTLASTNTSLAYPPNVPLTPTGGRLETTADSANNPAFRLLGTTMDLSVGSQTFYSSALFRRSAATGDLRSSVLFDQELGGAIRWYYGIDANGFFSTAVNPSAPTQRATSTFAAVPDTTYLLVSQIRTNTGPGGNDQVFLRVFAQGSPVSEPLSDAEWDLTASGTSGILDRIRLAFSNVAGQTNQFDELRVGTSFADVTGIPEPGSGLLFAFGAMLIARRRRS